MNERIRQLRGQVKLDIDQYQESLLKLGTVMLADDGANEVLNAYLAKFAELIVAECLSVIEEMNPHDPERDIDDIFDEVKQHFGVEE